MNREWGSWMVGEPSPNCDYAEGFDGSRWEFYGNPGLVIRPTGEPAAAGRHTAYFDDPLVYFGTPGWSFEKIEDARIGADDAFGIRATMPDSFQRGIYVSAQRRAVSDALRFVRHRDG